MLEELNNILDRTNNWIVFEEARNSGLIALNLGLISFIFNAALSGKKIILALSILSIIISTYSFIGKKLFTLFPQKLNKEKEEKENSLEKLINKNEVHEQNPQKADLLFTESRVIIKRDTVDESNKRNSSPDKGELFQYISKNIYDYKDMAEIDEETLLLLVHQRLLKRNEKDEYPININREYQFKLAHRDLSKMIHRNSRICLIKSKCFFISLGLFIVNIICMGIVFLMN